MNHLMYESRGRPTKGQKRTRMPDKSFRLRLPPDLGRQIRACAKKCKISQNALLLALLRKGLA
jgi:predicted HicB family RNase H-like nuclease